MNKKIIVFLLLFALISCGLTGCNKTVDNKSSLEREVQTTTQIDETRSNEMQDLFNCKAEKLQSGITDKEVTIFYNQAYQKGKIEGYTPVVVLVNDQLKNTITDNYNGSADEFCKSILSADTSNGKELLEARMNYVAKQYGEELEVKDEEFEALLEFADFDKSCLSVTSYMGDASDSELYMLYVPTENPYEIFAWLPFGGWNECPDAKEMVSVCRYWYEEYGAAPAFVSSDTLMLYFTEPIKDKDLAKKIAPECCAFCSEVLGVADDMGGVSFEATMVMNANVWSFWWD